VFHSEYEHTLDAKGRLIIPSAYRKGLTDGVYVTRGVDGCLHAYPIAVWEEEIKPKVEGLPFNQRKARQFARMMYTGMTCQLDRQGRILIPNHLRHHSDIHPGAQVTVVGYNRWLEIWNTERWRKTTHEMMADSDILAEGLGSI
jgi:MraZ protein